MAGAARRIAEGFGLHHLSNIQFRMLGDRPVLMDVNTRPAGGLHQLAQCGVNVPWAAVRLALGDDPGRIEPPFLGQDYTVVSGPRPLLPVTVLQRTDSCGGHGHARRPARAGHARRAAGGVGALH